MPDDGKTLMQQLQAHDWYYCYADDQRKWRAGETEHWRLIELIRSKGFELDLTGFLLIGLAIGKLHESSMVSPLTEEMKQNLLDWINSNP